MPSGAATASSVVNYGNAMGSGYAYATEGQLKTSGFTQASSFLEGVIRADVKSHAEWRDSLTVNAAGVLRGTSGYVIAEVDVSGFFLPLATPLGTGNGYEYIEMVRLSGTGMNHVTSASLFCTGSNYCNYDNQAGGFGYPFQISRQFADIPSTVQLNIPITFGHAASLLYYLDVTSMSRAVVNIFAPSDPMTVSALVDYGHSMTWGGILGVYDAYGTPVTDFTLESQSGFDYLTDRTPTVAPVPEPNSVALGAIGLLGIIARRRWQRTHGGCGVTH